jgi:hypothetical protein
MHSKNEDSYCLVSFFEIDLEFFAKNNEVIEDYDFFHRASINIINDFHNLKWIM